MPDTDTETDEGGLDWPRMPGYELAAEWRDKFKTMEAERDELVKEVERLKGEYESMKGWYYSAINLHDEDCGKLTGALEPFAAYARRLPADVGDTLACAIEVCRPTPSLGDCRRAAEVLAEIQDR